LPNIQEILIKNDVNVETFFKNLPTPTYVWQKRKDDYILVDCNKILEKITNNEILGAIGMKASEYYRDNTKILRDLDQCVAKNKVLIKERQFFNREINEHQLLSLMYSFLPPDLVLIQIIDITNHKKIESMLLHSEKWYRLIAENAKDLFIIVNKKLRIEYVNKNPLFNIYGYTVKEMIGKKPIEFVHPEDREIFLKHVAFNLKSGSGMVQARLKHKRGNYIWTASTESLYKFKENDFKILIITRDISEQKKIEVTLKNSQERYQNAYEQLKFYKDLFVHDMNNIFQNISSSIQLSSQHVSKNYYNREELNKFLKIARNSAIRGSKLLSNIYYLTDTETEITNVYPLDVIEVLHRSVSLIKTAFLSSNIDIQIISLFKYLEINANQLLQEIFDNILINAINHNLNLKIKIVIRLSKIYREGINYLKVEFMDNGVGIPDSYKTQIFQERKGELRYKKGMGFGLSLVKKIVDSFKGKIWVEDKIKGDHSKGSNFILFIPTVR